MTVTIPERFTLPARDGWGDRERETRRTSPFTLVRAEGDEEAGDGKTLDGYAAVFNRQTIIDSWEGRFKEQVAKGSMKRSFAETPPIVQFDHGRHAFIGSIPIAALEPGFPREEDDPERAPEGGAHVVARLHQTWMFEPVREAIASGSINGMSFRFSVMSEMWHDPDGKRITDEEMLREALRRTWYEEVPDEELLLRTLKQLKVPELGPVVWPAYGETSVGVRSTTVTIDLSRLSEREEQNKLARIAIEAARAETESEQQVTEESAGERKGEVDDTQPITARRVAETHESAAKRLERQSFVRKALSIVTPLTERNSS